MRSSIHEEGATTASAPDRPFANRVVIPHQRAFHARSMIVDGMGPRNQIAVGHHNPRYIDRQAPVAELVEMQDIRPQFMNQRGQICR